MATKTEGERALADLEAGKFSFHMVDAIRDHVSKLETELQRVTAELSRVSALHDGAANQMRQQEYTIFRLEAELRKLNARLYALLKANALTEIAVREAKRGAAKFVEYLPVARKHAEQGSKAALAYLATVDFKGKFEELKTHPLTVKALAWLANFDPAAEWTKLKTHPLTQKALSGLQTLLLKAQEYLPVAQKQVAPLVDKATAYFERLHKKVA